MPSDIDTAALRELAEKATPGIWKWWTSNSWRRLKRDDRGITTPVIEPFVARDGHPDVSVSDDDMAYIEAARPSTILSLLDEHDALRARVAELDAECQASMATIAEARTSVEDARRRVVTALDQAQGWRARATAAEAQVAARDAEIARLREALEPFATFGDFLASETTGFADTDALALSTEDGHLLDRFRVGDFCRARAALSGTHEEEGDAGWRPVETAPEDEHVILATTGGFVGEALMLRDENTGTQKWTWALGPVHQNHVPLGWQPMPDAPKRGVK